MNRPDDSYDAAVMRIVVQPLLDEDLARFDEYNKIPHECSDEFMQRIDRLFKREKIKKYKKMALTLIKRVAICAMVGIMIVLSSCAAIKPLREKIVNAVVEWYSEYVVVYFEGTAANGILRMPTYIPETYSVVHESIFEDYAFIRYSDKEGNLLTFTGKPVGEDETLYDQERHTIEPVIIRNIGGLYFKSDSGESILTWSEDGFSYNIIGDCPEDELMKIAENVE